MTSSDPSRAAPGPFRVLVTGSRSWRGGELVFGELDKLAAQCRLDAGLAGDTLFRQLLVVHGGAGTGEEVGADFLADEWVRSKHEAGYPPELVDRDVHPAGADGPLSRNRRMVATGPDVVLAFIRACDRAGCRDRSGRRYPDGHGTHGATHTALLALEAGLELHVWRQP